MSYYSDPWESMVGKDTGSTVGPGFDPYTNVAPGPSARRTSTPVVNPVIDVVSIDPIPVPVSNGIGGLPASQPGTSQGFLEGIFGGLGGFFGGLFGGNGQSTGGGMDFMQMFMLMQLMGGNRGGGGGMNNILMLMMLMGSGGNLMQSGGMLGTANPLIWMMLPRMGTMKTLMLGGPEALMMSALFKPAPRRRSYRKQSYRRPYRRNYRRYY